MKPSFALDLRDEQVTLLHRTSRGWLQVGSTRFDAPDLAEALAYMRSTALGLSPRGISTKLIIPNDQVLYTQVTAPGPDASKRKRQVKAALDGLTPYAVEDVAHDIFGTGPEVQVAVVARETLDQAEAFAAEHRFNPVSFVAVPENGLFLGEPFFGPTKLSPALLSDGEKVERDSEPMIAVTREMPRAAEPEPKPELKPEADPEPAQTQIAATDAPHDIAAMAQALPPAADAGWQTQAIGDDAPPLTPIPDAALLAPDAGLDSGLDSGPDAGLDAVSDPAPEMAPEMAPEPAAEPDPQTAPQPALQVAPEPIPPPPATPAEPPTAAALKKSLAAIPVTEDLPPPPAEAFRAALAARRGQEAPAAPVLGAPPAAAGRPASAKPVGAIDAGALKSGVAATKPAKPTLPAKSLKGMGAMVTAPGIPGAGRRKVAPSTFPTATVTSGSAAGSQAGPGTGKPLTGLGGRPVPARGRPRYLGLILTGVLLVFLALAAAWSSFFLAGLGSDETAPAATEFSQTDPTDAGGATGLATDPLPSAEDEALADGQGSPVEEADAPDAAAASAPDTGQEVEQAATAPLATDAAAADAAASVETTSEAAAEPAPDTAVSTEAAAAQGPGSSAGDEIFLAAIEPATQLSDPVTLPASMAGDALPQPAPEPPPFGTIYQFDSQGRVVPTAEGILSPEGVLLVAGPPTKLPPPRPAAIAALAPAVATAAATVTAEPSDATAAPADAATSPAESLAESLAESPAASPATTPGAIPLDGTAAAAEPFPSDPALQDFRPKDRPADLAPAATTSGDLAEPDPAETARLATVRPRARAVTVAVAAAPAAAASTAGLNGTAATDSATVTATDTAAATAAGATSALAVAVSRVPTERPAALAQAVNAAVNAAVADAGSDGGSDNTASAEPEAQSEPEVETAAPTIPSNASVAKTATEKDALALSKVALIGVFGSDSNRYAYVRLASGALKKVTVGDNLDGGKVVAISPSELRYQKNGKVIVLQMPKEG